MDATRSRVGDDLTRLATDSAGHSSSPGDLSGRFTPGTLFAGRFRIVAPLGRGGMGEVYRAEDLRLGQTVALKLLPDHFAHDAGRLAQFHNEVRIARTIAHKNVCRTYDIGDADGRPFLTMEYVDGEDLSSLLRRIGRFPQDKAIEVARQICAGLAAAHERGVLHRDLKPANIMIDGEGQARITDFGLASVGGAVDNIRAGTPAYMAPEQLAGKEVTARSDIYALGLVLFELFTGKRVFEANTLNDLISLHESSSIASPRTLVSDLNPSIERAILRCLEHEPAKRPPSALAVSSSLPGGDQLAAALAAGETPSPEMVAAAGEQSAVQPVVGLAIVALTVAMLVVLAVLSDRYSLVNRIPLPRSTDSLKDRGQEILERLGFREPPADATWGWSFFSRAYLGYAAEHSNDSEPWTALPSGRTGTAAFWYRTSPRTIVPSYGQMRPLETDPPLTISDMRLVKMDGHGRLVEFQSIPPQVDERVAADDVDWSAAFDLAGLDRTTFHPVDPHWRPRGDADARVAWEGPLPDIPDTTVRVEAAAAGGVPTYFAVVAPWTVPTRMTSAVAAPGLLTRLVAMGATAIVALMLFAAAFLAKQNLRSGRGDRRGAFRTAVVIGGCQLAAWLIRSRHFSDVSIEWTRIEGTVASACLSGGIAWLAYIGLEPYARRFWPQLLIGWTRLLSGRVRDPLVGRNVLIGAAAGTIAALLIGSLEYLPRILGAKATSYALLPSAEMLLGTRYAIASALDTVKPSFTNAIQCLAVFIILKIIVKRTWVVLPLAVLLIMPIAMTNLFTADYAALQLPIFVTGVILMFVTLLRFGFLALVVAFLTMSLAEVFPMTLNMSRPYAGTSIVLMLGIAALSAFGYYASRGDEPLFGRDLLDRQI